MRILWFTNTSGLVQGSKNASGGWISSLQEQIENREECELGLVYYSDSHFKSFRKSSTHYFPVRRIGYNRWKRKLMQLTGRIETDENLAKFQSIIDDFKPDIIHIHGTENPFGLIIKKRRDIPILISVQGILNTITYKYFSSDDTYRFVDWMRKWNFFIARKYTIFKKKAEVERHILSDASYVAGRTDWDRRVTSILAPQAQYFHIDELLRPIFYTHEWEPPENNIFRLITVLSDQPYKGVSVLLNTAMELKRSGFKFEWHVAGLDWDAQMISLFGSQNAIKKLPIKLLGKISEDKIVSELFSANCFVQVSQIENSSNSLGEAMILGLPCIATATGGTATILKDLEDGVLTPEGDYLALAGGIYEYANKYDKWIEMGIKARETARKRHSTTSVLNQLLSTYDRLVLDGVNKAS